MGSRIRKVWWVATGGIAIVAGAYLFAVVRPLAVEVAAPVREAPIRVFGLGTVEADVVSKVGFQVEGTVATVTAQGGDRVEEGKVLARLDADEQAARVEKARAQTERARADLDKARQNVARAEAVLDQRRATNRRKQALVGKGTISREEADEAGMAEAVAEAELAVARSEVSVARANLTDARAERTYQQTLLDQHVLSAPYDAVVVTRHQDRGDVLKPGDPVFTLVDPETVWVLAYIDEARAGPIEVGQPAEIRLRSRADRPLRGRVARIDVESDRVAEERRVYVECQQCPDRFHLGEQAEVFIRVAEVTDALMVPETALTDDKGDHGSVWTLEDGTLHQRRVELGLRTLDGRVVIQAGVPEGARVVDQRRPGLREGRWAHIAAEESA